MEGLSGLALRDRSLPIAVVGSGLGGDCVPPDSNHSLYYQVGRGGTRTENNLLRKYESAI